MKRYVNIYKDEKGRHISNVDWDNPNDAKTLPIDKDLIIETVRILSAEEEKEFAWEWYIRKQKKNIKKSVLLGISWKKIF
jgi:hypothetical protein